jgi:PAS domain S-box-containing protein
MSSELSHELLLLLSRLAAEEDEHRIKEAFREVVNSLQHDVTVGEFAELVDGPALEVATPRTHFGAFPISAAGEAFETERAALEAAAASLAALLEGLSSRQLLRRRERALERDIEVATYELNARTETYRMLLDSVEDAVYLWSVAPDGDMTCREANAAARRMLGYSYEQFIDSAPFFLVADDTQPCLADYLDRLRRERSLRFETIHAAADGTRIPVVVTARLAESGGEPVVVSAVRDLQRSPSNADG